MVIRTTMSMIERPAMTIEAAPVVARALAADTAVSAALFAWFSPAFPTGGFAYSHGIEAAAAEGAVAGESDLALWIEALLSHGGGWTDAVLLNAAHRVALADNEPGLSDLAALAEALSPSRERLAETLGQGEAFSQAVAAGWPRCAWSCAPLRLAHPLAAGIACARLGACARTALTAYLTAFSANLCAVGVRLGLTGQTGAIRILAALGPTIVSVAERAAGSTLDDLGSCALGSDIAAMRHETLCGRLFIS